MHLTREIGWAAPIVVLTMLGASRPTPLAAQSDPPIVRAIEVRRAPVFDSTEARFWPYRVVNALHIVTRPYVIRRELLIRPGEPYDTARVHESERNLRALGIFRDVRIDTVMTDSGVVARVTTADGWTTEPSFNISSTGTQVVVSAFIAERNLLGTRTVASVGYVSDPDRRSVLVGFDTPRLIANRIGVGALLIDRSDGRAASGSLRYPFFSLSSRGGGSVFAQSVDTRVLRYVGGRSRAADSLRRKFALYRGDAAIALAAGPRGYARLGLTGQLRNESYGREGRRTAPIPDTATAAAGPYLALRRVHYIQTRNFEAMEQVEDVDLGIGVRASVLAAPRQWGYARSGVGTALDVGVGTRVPLGFARFAANLGALRTSDGLDSASAIASGTLVLQPAARHLFVANGSLGYLKNPRPGGEFDIGLGYGVRAFPSHSFTGNHQYLLNAEYRWIAIPRLFEVLGIGIAGFVDHGGAWYGSNRRTGTDAGVGLRFGSIRSAGSIIGRLDLAWRRANDRQPAGWVVSLGRGFVFQRF